MLAQKRNGNGMQLKWKGKKVLKTLEALET